MNRSTRLAWHDLMHRRARTTAALGGVLFAILLIFMQLGFYMACRDSSIRVHDLLDFDLALTSPRYSNLVQAHHFSERRLQQAAAVDGVDGVAGVRVGASLWRSNAFDNRYDNLVVGIDPSDRLFVHPEIAQQQALLKRPDTVLFDRVAHPLQGDNPPGTVTEIAPADRIAGRQVEVVGTFAWGAGFVANGVAVTGQSTFAQIFPNRRPGNLQLGLIRLHDEADQRQVMQTLQRLLPEDVLLWSRSQLEARDRRFFLRERPIGLMFTSGVALAMLVGGMILFQVLASEVTSRRDEFATLQAIGYAPHQVVRVVLEQGLLYTLMAYLPAALLATLLFRITRQMTRLPMQLDGLQLAVVLLASLTMCISGALLASGRVRTADPADLF